MPKINRINYRPFEYETQVITKKEEAFTTTI